MSIPENLSTLSAMETKDILKHLNAKKFFETYLPTVKRWKQKMWGKDSKGNPLDFSADERKDIIKALDKMFKDLKKK